MCDELGTEAEVGLENGPLGSARPSRDHDGGHGFFMLGLREDPANQTKRWVYPQIEVGPRLEESISGSSARGGKAAPKDKEQGFLSRRKCVNIVRTP